MANEEKQARTIVLSEDTAALLDAKKKLDELNEELGRLQDKIQGYNEEFEIKSSDAYCTFNRLIMNLINIHIDIESTESNYETI